MKKKIINPEKSLLKSDKIQVIYVDRPGFCSSCQSCVTDLGNFTYIRVESTTSRYKNEFCICKKCKKPFLLRYNFFDAKGHVKPFVFMEDANNLDYCWQDQLTPEQLSRIGYHIYKDHLVVNGNFVSTIVG